MQRRDLFDYILVETTGLADPGSVASAFWLDDQLESPLVLDGIVCVVDAKHILRHLWDVSGHEGHGVNVQQADAVAGEGHDSGENAATEAQRQIALADRILLNKVDLVTDQKELGRIISAIRAINPFASIFHTVRSEIDVNLVLDIRAFDITRALEIDPDAFTGHHDHLHDCSIKTVRLVVQGKVLNEGAVERWLGTLLWEQNGDHQEDNGKSKPQQTGTRTGMEIFRCKGVLSLADEDDRYVFQGVHTLFEVQSTGRWPEGDTRTNRMVFIGRRLDESALEEMFRQSCLHAGS
mmetsp:Transcript_29768/g.48075  ORF Transcript_29768/g.48075 Transcript_29768/m.48075 type:complete len:294 (-) Transcript_29768:352-1233(-)